MNITINISEPIKKVQEFQEYDLGQITTTLQDLLNSSSIIINSNTIPILKVLSIDDIVKKYLIKDLSENSYNTGDYITGQDLVEEDLLLISGNDQNSETSINTAFTNKAYSAIMNIVHDDINPNFEIDLVGNLDLTVIETENGDSGLINLYFVGTKTATINGFKGLVLTGIDEMIPIYFIHDTDGIKWYDGRESLSVDISNLAIKEGTRLYHDLSSGYSQTMTNVGVNCVASYIAPNMVGWEIIKANGEKAVIASITNFTNFTTVEPFATDSVGIGITAKAPSIWVKSNGAINIYNKDGELKIAINADGSLKIGDSITQAANGIMTLTNLWSFGEMFFESSSSSVHVPQYGSFNSGLGTSVDVKLERYDAGVWVVLDGSGNPGNLRANKFLMLSNTTYANDAAADADATLQSGSFYMITGDRTIKRKP